MSDALERLSRENLAQGGHLVLTHLHRYEFAAQLVSGRRVVDLGCGIGYGTRVLAQRAASVIGVDIDDNALKAATEDRDDDDVVSVRFERADAVDFLRDVSAADVDAAVCFEALEHLPEPSRAIDEMARLAREGVRVIASLPNDRAFEKDNPFHLVDVGHGEAMSLFARLGKHLVLGQFFAEGSVIALPDGWEASACTLAAPTAPELPWANHFIALANVPVDEVARAHAHLGAAVRPYHNEYMRELESTVDHVYAETQRLLAELLDTQAELLALQRSAGGAAGSGSDVRHEQNVSVAEKLRVSATTLLQRFRRGDA